MSQSKGKRSRKRKRKHEDDQAVAEPPKTEALDPPIAARVFVGFNSVNRHVEMLSGYSANELGVSSGMSFKPDVKPKHLAAVFLLRPPSDLIYSHLPTSCFTASLAHRDRPPTRLVMLDPSAEKRLCDAMGTPRVSIVAVVEPEDDDDAAGLGSLSEFVRKHVSETDAGWLKDAVEAKWLGTKVDVQ